MQRDRGYLRFQRDRIISKRLAALRSSRDQYRYDRFVASPNRLHKTDAWDCGIAKCPVCHSGWDQDPRGRTKQAWKKFERSAW